MIFKILLLIAAVATAVPLGAEQKWHEFKLTHNKVYDNQDQERFRFQVFSENLRKIEEHNAKYKAGLVSWYKGVTKFSDMTQEEFRKFIECKDIPHNLEGNGEIVDVSKPLAAGVDFRSIFNPVRDQGDYGTCYAFSTTSAVEAYRNRARFPRQILSPQDIVDCTYLVPPYNNNGSDGGSRHWSLQYMADKGITLESDYPYVGNPGRCRHNSYRQALKIQGFTTLRNTAQNLKTALNAYGPLTIGVNSTEWESDYTGGIVQATQPFTGTDHAVVLVGYGTDNGEDYWLVRNSWGPNWGEGGHIRISGKIVGNIHFGIAGPGSYPAQAVRL